MKDRRKNPPEAISIRKAAEILGVHTITVRRWIRSRKMLAYRVGPQLIRIPRSEISRMRKVRLSYQVEGDRPQYPLV